MKTRAFGPGCSLAEIILEVSATALVPAPGNKSLLHRIQNEPFDCSFTCTLIRTQLHGHIQLFHTGVPVGSYSDGYSYPTYVKGLVNSGWTGLAWAPEVRYATCDADYARRVQLMLLGAQSQFNAWERGDLPFHCRGEMWEMFQRHYNLRARLLLYLYTAHFTMSRSGYPIVAPLPLAFPEDMAARRVDDQLMLGPSLMFAPGGLVGGKAAHEASIVPASNATSRSVFFPTVTVTAAAAAAAVVAAASKNLVLSFLFFLLFCGDERRG